MQKYLQDTKAMVKEQKYQEANERYLWYYNHGLEHDSSIFAVRNSFMLSYWMNLATVYPPAMTAMKDIRDNKTKLILDSAVTFSLVHDAMSLDRALHENSKSIELFEFLIKKYPEMAERCFYLIKKQLFEEKRYDILISYIKNPFDEYTSIHTEFVRDTSVFSNSSMPKVNAFAATFAIAGDKNSFVVKCVQLINFCNATNNFQTAIDIQQKALAVVDDNRLRDAMQENKK